MAVDYSFKILETFLMAKKYKSREDVLASSKLVVDVVCDVGNLSPIWIKSYKEAYKKLTSLSFSEMNEIIDILKTYDECEEEYKNSNEIDDVEIPKEDINETLDMGEREYDEGMKYFSQENYFAAAMCFKTSASKGNAKASYNYGLCLYNGKGINADKVEAIKQFVSASEGGIVQANKMLEFIAYNKGD